MVKRDMNTSNFKDRVYFFSLFSMLILHSCKVEREFVKLSESIDESVKASSRDGYDLEAGRDRAYLYANGYLKFINFDNDTIFCSQEFHVSSGNIYTSMWNARGNVSIVNEGRGKRRVIEEGVDSKNILCVSQWDEFKRKVLKEGNHGNTRISRTILRNRVPYTESLRFEFMFNLCDE